MIDLKLEFVKIGVAMCIGAFLALHFQKPVEPSSPAPIVQAAQSQQQACKVVQIIKQKPDGSSIQTLTISSDDLQEQGLSLKPKATDSAKKLGVGVSLFTDKSLGLRYEVGSNLSIIGKCDDIIHPQDSKLSLGIEFNF